MELGLFALMILVFAVGSFILKLPIGLSFLMAAVTGSLAGGHGFPVRHLVEGAFTYFDAVLIIGTAMIFMETIRVSGALAHISRSIILRLGGMPILLVLSLTLFVMFPGLITGLSSACVLTTGALIVPALIALDMPRKTVGAFISMAGVFGMVAPPINLPVMIIGSGVDMPYIGFELPLLFCSIPMAFACGIGLCYRHVKNINIERIEPKLPAPSSLHPLLLVFPILVVAVLLVAVRVVPRLVPDIGVPLIFVLGSLAGWLSVRGMRPIRIIRDGLRSGLNIMSLLVGVGVFVQIMALTGARGAVAVETLRLPSFLLYIGLGLVMPAFGSAFASVSIVGVPVLLALLGTNEIVVASALSLIGGVGDLMPPPTMLCVLSAEIIGRVGPFEILRRAFPWIVLTVCLGIVVIVFGNPLAGFLVP